MRRPTRALRAIALALLGIGGALLVLLAAAWLLLSSGVASRRLAGVVAGALDGLVPGQIRLAGLELGPGGGLELRDVVITDPAGHPVIRAERVRLRIGLAGLVTRTVGVDVEVDRAQVWLEPGEGGRLTIADAFHAATAPGRVGADPWGGWKIRVDRLRITEAALSWRDPQGRSRLQASGLAVDGAGSLSAAGVVAALTATGALAVPLEGPLSVELTARIEGSRLTVPRLVLGAAASRLEASGEWDWERETFRAAATRVALAERDLAALLGAGVGLRPLEGRVSAESDGKRITAEVVLTPPAGATGGGRAALTLLLGPGGPRRLGFDVVLDGIDPARLLGRAPRGRLSLAARGELAWPVSPREPLHQGRVTVEGLEVALPGLALRGSGRWRDAGELRADLRLTAADLAVAGPMAAALLGVELPALSGQGEASLELRGTAAAPEATLAVRLARATVAGTSVTGGRAELRLVGDAVALEASTSLGPLGGDLLTARGEAVLAPGWHGATLSRLELGLAGQAWTLSGPATVTFAGPSVDGAAFRSGAQRLTLAGGYLRGGAVDARLALDELDLSALPRTLAAESLGLAGRATGTVSVSGRAARLRLEARVTVAAGQLFPLTGLTLEASLGWRQQARRIQLEGRMTRGEGGTLDLAADLPWPLGGASAGAAVTARVAAAGWPLQWLLQSRQLDLPADGRLGGELTLAGSVGSPRLSAHAALTGGRWGEVQPLTLTAALDGSSDALRAEAELLLATTALARGRAELPWDRGALLHRPGWTLSRLAEAAWTAEVELPSLELATLAGTAGLPAGMGGRVQGRLTLGGTLAAPRGALSVEAVGLALGGHAVGDLTGTASGDRGAARLALSLAPTGGGTLRAEGTVALAGAPTLVEAPLQLTVKGEAMSPAFLPLLLPGRLRTASGQVDADLTVTGTARAPRLAGTVALVDGAASLPGYGTFHAIGFTASLDPRGLRVEELSLQRGAGRLQGRLAVEGLDQPEARVDGALTATNFGVARSGMDVATIDARAALGGRVVGRRLELDVAVERGATVRLPRKAPRQLQSLQERADIVIGEPRPAEDGGAAGTPPPAGAVAIPLEASVRVRGEQILVRSDQPRVHLELRTDATWDLTASPVEVRGALDAWQGTFEPLGGRLFTVVRGRVAFPGGPLDDAQLDLAADYQNPTALVHATVTGTFESPVLRLTSEPALDEASLAMLIVTGRTEVSAGGTERTGFTAQDAGMAASLALANRLFEEQLGEKMPLDSLTLDSTAVAAGKQLTDRIMVGYIRRFDARPEKGENTDEVRVQYHLSPRWTLESRYGNAGAGGASLIWQKDY